MVATKTDKPTKKSKSKKSKSKTVVPKVEERPLVDPGKWVPICIIAMAQDFDEATGKMLMSQSKALLEQHTGTKAIRTTKV